MLKLVKSARRPPFFMTDDIKTRNFKVGKKTLLCIIRPYYVKSRDILSKNTPFLFHGSVKTHEMLEKRKPFQVKFGRTILNHPIKL